MCPELHESKISCYLPQLEMAEDIGLMLKQPTPPTPNHRTALQTAYHCAGHVKTSLRQEMNS